jgi:hypothetical protein
MNYGDKKIVFTRQALTPFTYFDAETGTSYLALAFSKGAPKAAELKKAKDLLAKLPSKVKAMVLIAPDRESSIRFYLKARKAGFEGMMYEADDVVWDANFQEDGKTRSLNLNLLLHFERKTDWYKSVSSKVMKVIPQLPILSRLDKVSGNSKVCNTTKEAIKNAAVIPTTSVSKRYPSYHFWELRSEDENVVLKFVADIDNPRFPDHHDHFEIRISLKNEGRRTHAGDIETMAWMFIEALHADALSIKGSMQPLFYPDLPVDKFPREWVRPSIDSSSPIDFYDNRFIERWRTAEGEDWISAMLHADTPPGVRREDRHGITMFAFADSAGLAEDSILIDAINRHQKWLMGYISRSYAPLKHKPVRKDKQIDYSYKDLSPFTIFDPKTGIAYKQIFIFPGNRPDPGAWNKMKAIMANPPKEVKSIWLIAPFRELAIEFYPIAIEAGFGGVVYGADQKIWDPNTSEGGKGSERDGLILLLVFAYDADTNWYDSVVDNVLQVVHELPFRESLNTINAGGKTTPFTTDALAKTVHLKKTEMWSLCGDSKEIELECRHSNEQLDIRIRISKQSWVKFAHTLESIAWVFIEKCRPGILLSVSGIRPFFYPDLPWNTIAYRPDTDSFDYNNVVSYLDKNVVENLVSKTEEKIQLQDTPHWLIPKNIRIAENHGAMMFAFASKEELTSEDKLEIARMQYERWLAHLLIYVDQPAELSAFTLFDPQNAAAYKSLAFAPNGQPDQQEWNEIQKLPGNLPVSIKSIWLMVRKREWAVTFLADAKKAGFNGVVYTFGTQLLIPHADGDNTKDSACYKIKNPPYFDLFKFKRGVISLFGE